MHTYTCITISVRTRIKSLVEARGNNARTNARNQFYGKDSRKWTRSCEHLRLRPRHARVRTRDLRVLEARPSRASSRGDKIGRVSLEGSLPQMASPISLASLNSRGTFVSVRRRVASVLAFSSRISSPRARAGRSLDRPDNGKSLARPDANARRVPRFKCPSFCRGAPRKCQERERAEFLNVSSSTRSTSSSRLKRRITVPIGCKSLRTAARTRAHRAG